MEVDAREKEAICENHAYYIAIFYFFAVIASIFWITSRSEKKHANYFRES